MKATDLIRSSLELSQGWILGLVEDMKDSPLTQPTPNGGNHPLWCLGHLTYSEGHLIAEFVLGEQNPVGEWKEIFGAGSQCVADASRYPSFDEVLSKFQQIRTGTLKTLESLSDDDLDKPSKATGEAAEFCDTVGKCFAVTIVHFGFHGGQIADARRAAGRPPLMG